MLGVPVTLFPAVVLKPSFAATSKELESKFQGGSISKRSTLVVEGEGVEIADLTLDGALVIKAAPGVKLAVKVRILPYSLNHSLNHCLTDWLTDWLVP